SVEPPQINQIEVCNRVGAVIHVSESRTGVEGMRPGAVNKPLVFMPEGTHFRPVEFRSDAVAVPPSADVPAGNLDLVHVCHVARARARYAVACFRSQSS